MVAQYVRGRNIPCDICNTIGRETSTMRHGRGGHGKRCSAVSSLKAMGSTPNADQLEAAGIARNLEL